MPSVSKKQHNFMEAIAEFAKKAGVPQSVGKDFAAADARKRAKILSHPSSSKGRKA